MAYVYILLTIFFTAYGQLIMKWRVLEAGSIPSSSTGQITYFQHLFLDPWVLTGLLSAFLGAIAWMLTMAKFDLTYAYPFISFSFVLVFIFGAILFTEPVTATKIIGMSFIMLGLVVASYA